MSKTTNYQLTLWDYADEDFSPGRAREDLAANFTKLDTLLRSITDNMENKVEIAAGTYLGDGQDNREIILGIRPRAVHVEGPAGCRDSSVSTFYGGLIPESSITAQGFKVPQSANRHNLIHTYVAYM